MNCYHLKTFIGQIAIYSQKFGIKNNGILVVQKVLRVQCINISSTL